MRSIRGDWDKKELSGKPGNHANHERMVHAPIEDKELKAREKFIMLCRRIYADCPDSFARAYAHEAIRDAMTYSNREVRNVRIALLLGNMTEWQGHLAKAVKSMLRAL